MKTTENSKVNSNTKFLFSFSQMMKISKIINEMTKANKLFVN
jgi:hypothetical protein